MKSSAGLRGIAFMLTSGFFGVAMHATVREVSATIHPFEIAFFRNLFGLLFLLPMLWRAGGVAALRTRRLGLHGLRGLFNAFGMLSFFMALSLAPLADVTALSFTAPLFAMAGAALVLRERVGPRRWGGLLVGFAGTMIILRPGGDPASLGTLLAVFASAGWACAMLTIKSLGRTESSLAITAYAAIFLALIALPPAVIFWRWPSVEEFGLLLLIGALGSVTQLALAQSFREADASLVLPFDFVKLLWAAVLGFLLFTEFPDLWTWLGGAIIFSSTVYIAYRERVAQRSSR